MVEPSFPSPAPAPPRDGAAPAPGVHALLTAAVPGLADEIATGVAARVPLLDRPERPGSLRRVVRWTLERFTGWYLGEESEGARDEFFIALATREYHRHQTLDHVRAAWLIGARIGWHSLSETARRADVAADGLLDLAEAVFAFVEDVSTKLADAENQLRERASGSMADWRARLLAELLTEPGPVPAALLRSLAQQARWTLPGTVAGVAVDADWQDHPMITPALDPRILMDLRRADPVLVLPDPHRTRWPDLVAAALPGVRFAVGPAVPVAQAARSVRLARQAVHLVRRGVLPVADGRVLCADHMSTLLLAGQEELLKIIVASRLDWLEELRPAQRARIGETLAAWLNTGGSFPEIAERLCVHPQTIRYRMRQVEARFGERLHDPVWRFEMQMALQAETLLARLH